MKYRIEKDSLGKKKIPFNAFYGINTQRSKENFQISNRILPLELFYAIAEIKIATAQANVILGSLNRKQGSVIIKAAMEILGGKHDDQFVIDAFQAGAGTSTHMNVNEVIANRAIEILGGNKGDYHLIHPNDHVNLGQSTNDIFPGAIKIVTVKKIIKLIPMLKNLENSLLKKSKQFKNILKSGRTHLQDAVPITLGQEFHAYVSSIKNNIATIKSTLNYLKKLDLGKNAIGTGINTYPGYAKIILRKLKKVNKIDWEEARDPIYSTQNVTMFLEVSGALKLLAVDLTKMANDLRLLSSGPNTGLREIKLPAIEAGSSMMPGKINPSIAEMLNMVCFQVIGNDETISLCAQAGQLELNVMTPLIAKNLIESLTLLTNGIKTFDEKCVKGIRANKEICQYYFEHSSGLATLLNPYIGYDKAAEIVKESLRTGETISQIALKRNLISKKDLERILDHKYVTRPNLNKLF
mgnify:CR=1 FL=1